MAPTPAPHAPRARAASSTRAKFVPESLGEEDDEDYPDLVEVSDSEDDNSDSEDAEDVPNDEIADLLSSKTVPARGGTASSKPQTRQKSARTKRKQSNESASAPPPKVGRVTMEEVEDEGDAPKVTGVKNPIYLFYDIVPKNSEGSAGKPGDKHYRCRHGGRKIITITKAM
ncbi:hypothetical protein DFH09DRAFT_1319998 [Mycena vulgaris]|nr:hypothetical protein DFH09DRAFT_1319998 [Mycena vulgaris]